MLRTLTVVATVAVSTSFGGLPAQAYEAPWCAVINGGAGSVYWDCQYNSIAECRPHVLAGNRGFCNPNPRYGGPEQRRYKARGYRRY